jgi:hypothetical protein
MIDAMKFALEALTFRVSPDKELEAITALRQAIAEAEQWDTSDMAHRSGGLSVEQALDGLAETSREIEQEPVCDKDPHLCWSVRCQLGKICKNTAPPKRPVKSYTNGEPQYATDAPKREWVGLTDEEIVEILDIDNPTIRKFAYAIEAKLKERNNG